MPPLAPPHPWRTPLVAAALGAAAPLALAVGGAARPAPALAAAAVVAVLAGLAARRFAGPAAVVDAVVVPGGFSVPFEALAEALPDPLMAVAAGDDDRIDDGGAARIVFANAAARDLLRLTEESPLLVQAIRRPDALEAIEESLAGGLDRTVPFESGGTQERIWRLSSTRLPGVAGAGRIALVVLHDETDARRNERMRADFLANASHELRTPLASLTGFVETLRGAARDDENARDRFLAIMAAQADRMGRLINDLLSLSRIELNEHIRPSGSCDLAMAVNDVVDAMGTIADAARTRLDIRLPPRGEAVVLGDRDQILQVVQNLLDNALKYSPADGKATVEVAHGLTLEQAAAADPASPRLGDPAGGRLPLVTPDRPDGQLYAVVRVADEGPGMAREHLPRLSERFYRIEGQKSGERSGTGLGLAIVKHIVIRHRGGLMVESAPGRGTAFSAYFPLRPVNEPRTETSQDPVTAAPALS